MPASSRLCILVKSCVCLILHWYMYMYMAKFYQILANATHPCINPVYVPDGESNKINFYHIIQVYIKAS